MRSAAKIIKRSLKRRLAIFVDGVGVDRASRRQGQRIDLNGLIQALTNGIKPTFARYYTIIPHEDDSRHRAFLDAVERAGMSTLVKRLPPVGVERQASLDPEISCDIIAFSLAHPELYKSQALQEEEKKFETSSSEEDNIRIIVVCPSRDIVHALGLANQIGVETVLADFGDYQSKDLIARARQWIDLSQTKEIWVPGRTDGKY